MCVYRISLSGSSWHLHWRFWDPEQRWLSKCLPLTPDAPKTKGSGLEEHHQETPICMALSHPEMVGENLWLGIQLTYKYSLKIYVTTVKQLLFLLPLPTDYVEHILSFFHYSRLWGYQSSEQTITCFIGRQTVWRGSWKISDAGQLRRGFVHQMVLIQGMISNLLLLTEARHLPGSEIRAFVSFFHQNSTWVFRSFVFSY